MKNDKTSYVVLEHELNLMSELGTDEESGEGGVLFLLHDNSFYAFNETACNMWKIISTNSDYKNAKQQIFGLYPQIKTELHARAVRRVKRGKEKYWEHQCFSE